VLAFVPSVLPYQRWGAKLSGLNKAGFKQSQLLFSFLRNGGRVASRRHDGRCWFDNPDRNRPFSSAAEEEETRRYIMCRVSPAQAKSRSNNNADIPVIESHCPEFFDSLNRKRWINVESVKPPLRMTGPTVYVGAEPSLLTFMASKVRPGAPLRQLQVP